jgi:flavin-binding protein dodecin
MSKHKVNKKVKYLGNSFDKVKGSWNQALTDAEGRLKKALREAAEWRVVVRNCREKVNRGAFWPGHSGGLK